MAKELTTSFSLFGSTTYAHALGELKAHIAMLVEQLGTQGCSQKTLGSSGQEVS